jgi:anaphase-promoting complex subunit 3
MSLEDSKAVTRPAFLPQIRQHFQTLIWTCLDFDLVRSAAFYAELYLVMDENNHDTRQLHAVANPNT